MIHILTLAPSASDGTSFYRLAGVMPFLKKEYNDISITDNSYRDKVDWNDYTGYDIVVLQRPFLQSHLNIIKLLKSMNIKVIIDYDDDVLNLENHNPYYVGYEQAKPTIIEIASLADEIWVSTEGLKETFSEYNKNITIIPNAHNDYLFPVKEKKEFNLTTKKVSYRGGKTHELDVYAHKDEWLEMINNNLDFDFTFVGARFPLMETSCGDNYLIVEGLHIIEFFKYFYELNTNIFIYPLQNTKFNRAKSNISWIETTYAGGVVLAPQGFNEFIKPGMLNYKDNFLYLFDRIKDDYKVLKILNDISWNFIQQNLLLSQVNQKRYNSIVEVKNRK